MKCKNCGHALPSKGFLCPNCGVMMDKTQIAFNKANKIEGWDEYSTMSTAKYKSSSAYDVSKFKGLMFLLIVVLVLVLIALVKMLCF